MNRPIRIAFLGNQGNNAFRLCRWAREAGAAADLLRLIGDKNQRSSPESIDPSLATDMPAWIRILDWNPEADLRWREGLQRSAPHEEARAIEADYDVVVTSGRRGLLAGRSIREIPVVHLSLGSEVTDLPRKLTLRGVEQRDRIKSLYARQALAQASAVVTSYSRTVRTLVDLGHGDKTRLWGFPEDIEGNRSRIDEAMRAELDARYADYEVVFIWLSRLNFLDPDAGDYKGAERFLDAYERVVREHPGRRVHAIIGRHGHHAEQFVERVEEKGLGKHIDFVPHLPYWQLLTTMSLRNGAVFDLIDVQLGTLGGVCREALSAGALLAMAIDRTSMDAFYGPDCPILDTPDAEACHRAMLQILDMSGDEKEAYRARIGAWALRHVDRRARVDLFLRIVEEAVHRFRIDRQTREWD